MKAARASVAAIALLIAGGAQALVVRHDVDDQEFLALARDYPSIVALRPADAPQNFNGMGTLIHPRWVLTAAHVADSLHPGDLADVGGGRVEIEAVVPSPGWQGFHRREDYLRDIALVRLKSAVTRVAPARLYVRDDEEGCVATFVGRGSYGTGLTGPSIFRTEFRAATNRVDEAKGSGLRFRFDAPGDAGVTALEGISGEGDSGGPAFCMRDGVTYLIGVSSSQDARPAGRQIGHYGVLEFYARVSSHAKWIRETIASAGDSR